MRNLTLILVLAVLLFTLGCQAMHGFGGDVQWYSSKFINEDSK